MKKDNFQKILDKLTELHKAHPSYSYGHINSMAFAEYRDTFSITDKESLFAIEKYECELDLDSDPIASPDYMSKLYKDIENFDNILNDEDEL